jgi:hypothetical protein
MGVRLRIYKTEKDDGLESRMQKSSVAILTAPVKATDIEQHRDATSIVDLLKANSTVQTVEELLGKDQPDLALVVSILVSTGWNNNDDVFTPIETWKARSTPLHKPMNDGHQGDKVLGHIVEARVLDKSGNEITVAENETPPDEFDIEVAGVLYRGVPELTERINEIIAKAETGEMFVSMEVWFSDFDYGVINSDTGTTRFIERTEATSFLTKHLKIYEGSGEYQGYRIGRVIKDMTFGAQGFTENPANPDSVIKVVANKTLEGGVEDMEKEKTDLEVELQTKLDEARAALEDKTTEVAELQKAVEDFKAKDYDGLSEKVEKLTAGATEASEKTKAVEVERDELQKLFDEMTKRAEKSEAELGVIRKNEMARDRFAQLSEVKKIDDEEATLAELCEMTDDTFAVVLKYAGQVEPDKSEAEKEVEAAKAALDNVEEKEEADLIVANDKEAAKEEAWKSVATGLLGRKEKKDEGGE